jgi:hypothetical protein
MKYPCMQHPSGAKFKKGNGNNGRDNELGLKE